MTTLSTLVQFSMHPGAEPSTEPSNIGTQVNSQEPICPHLGVPRRNKAAGMTIRGFISSCGNIVDGASLVVAPVIYSSKNISNKFCCSIVSSLSAYDKADLSFVVILRIRQKRREKGEVIRQAHRLPNGLPVLLDFPSAHPRCLVLALDGFLRKPFAAVSAEFVWTS